MNDRWGSSESEAEKIGRRMEESERENILDIQSKISRLRDVTIAMNDHLTLESKETLPGLKQKFADGNFHLSFIIR